MQTQQGVKMEVVQRSDRVKCVDFHPSEPWILSAMHTGKVCIWNHQTKTLVRSVQVSEKPVRTAKFIAQKQWIVAGCDDGFIRVYNCDTMEEVQAIEAHADYVRCVAVHPTLPYLLSASDDKLIKLWDWDKNWTCAETFEGHSHYVMQVAFHPKEIHAFASASLDCTIKIWNFSSSEANLSIYAHSKGVNCIAYNGAGDNGAVLIISGSDDQTAKVWDDGTKNCVQTLVGHTHNVTAACFHPDLPIVITGAEDETVCIWNATTYKLEKTLNHGLKRVWSFGCLKSTTGVAVGYDEGTIIFEGASGQDA